MSGELRVGIQSLNVGALQPVSAAHPDKRTGIHKLPVPGAVAVQRLGLAGDRIGNTRVHGGHDQAVYLYSETDYAWWRERVSDPLTPGTFGENITIDDWWPEPRVGDRVTIGGVVLELTAPRIPCATLAARMNDAQFVKTFSVAARGGAYARVLSEGTITAGDVGVVTPANSANVSIAEAFALWYRTPRDTVEVREALRDALRSPVASRLRLAFAEWLGDN